MLPDKYIGKRIIRVHTEKFWSMEDIMYLAVFLFTEDYKLVQTIFFPTESCLTVKSRVSCWEGHWNLSRPSVGNMQGWVDILIHGMDVIVYTWQSNSLSRSVKCYTYCFRTAVEGTLINVQKELMDMYVCMFQKWFPLCMEHNSIHHIGNWMRRELSAMPKSLPGAQRTQPKFSLSLSVSLWCPEKLCRWQPLNYKMMLPNAAPQTSRTYALEQNVRHCRKR